MKEKKSGIFSWLVSLSEQNSIQDVVTLNYGSEVIGGLEVRVTSAVHFQPVPVQLLGLWSKLHPNLFLVQTDCRGLSKC